MAAFSLGNIRFPETSANQQHSQNGVSLTRRVGNYRMRIPSPANDVQRILQAGLAVSGTPALRRASSMAKRFGTFLMTGRLMMHGRKIAATPSDRLQRIAAG